MSAGRARRTRRILTLPFLGHPPFLVPLLGGLSSFCLHAQLRVQQRSCISRNGSSRPCKPAGGLFSAVQVRCWTPELRAGRVRIQKWKRPHSRQVGRIVLLTDTTVPQARWYWLRVVITLQSLGCFCRSPYDAGAFLSATAGRKRNFLGLARWTPA